MKKLFLVSFSFMFFNIVFSSHFDKKNNLAVTVQYNNHAKQDSDSSFVLIKDDLDTEIVSLIVIDQEGVDTINVKDTIKEDVSLSCYDMLIGYVMFFTEYLKESFPDDSHKKD